MKYIVKSITENSWLVFPESDNTSVGLLTHYRNEYTLLSNGVKYKFQNKDSLNAFFKCGISHQLETAEKVNKTSSCFVDGYPINIKYPHEIYNIDVDLPLYSKTKTSNILYSAGYYCVNFPKSWIPVFCPKLSTLNTHKYIGPFKTKEEVRKKLSEVRKLSIKHKQ